MIRKLVDKFWDFVLGDTEAVLDEFLEKFPGRCPICSFDRAARVATLNRKDHACPELDV